MSGGLWGSVYRIGGGPRPRRRGRAGPGYTPRVAPPGVAISPAEHTPCRAPWDGAVIHFSGAVYPCDQLCRADCHDSLLLGHLSEQSLGEILRGPPAAGLRRRLLRGQLDGLCCAHCDKAGTCNLYGDPQGGREGYGGAAPVAGAPLGAEPLPLARLELGVTDLCNMACTMCALSWGEASPPGLPARGFMALPAARRAIEEAVALAEGPIQLLLHWVGEPLIYPELSALLETIDGLGDRVRLHLVTNGIALGDALIEQLLAMGGPHTLNVSLNALDADTFRRVNQSGQRDRVYANLERFLSRREALGARYRWSFIASAVVLEDNREQLPDFVRWWRRRLGVEGLALNGKGEHGCEQVMLLSEAHQPRSAARFRRVLAALSVSAPDWPLAPWAAIDGWLLGEGALGPALSSLEAHPDPVGAAAVMLAALAEAEVPDPVALEALLRWLARAPEPGPIAGAQVVAALRRLALDRGLRTSASEALLRLADRIDGVALVGLALAPGCAGALAARAFSGDWARPAALRTLAGALAMEPGLAAALPAALPELPDTGDLSAALVLVAAGDPRASSRVAAALAGGARTPAWQLRALRRQILTAGCPPAGPWSGPGLQGALLGLSTCPLSAAAGALAAVLREQPSAAPEVLAWQQLAEVFAYRPGLAEALGPDAAEPLIRRLEGEAVPPAGAPGLLHAAAALAPGWAWGEGVAHLRRHCEGARETLEPWMRDQLDETLAEAERRGAARRPGGRWREML